MAVKGCANAGEWAEVRPLSEIKATLDASGSLDAMPFMPEMAKFVGRRFQIVKSAHKTCDPTGSSDLRSMSNAVHLETRCDGSAHDGCEARCLLFWKNAWLKPVSGPATGVEPVGAPEGADLAPLLAATRKILESGEVRYRCQATEIVAATEVLPTSNLRQYVEDVSTRNIPLSEFLLEMIRFYGGGILRKAATLAGLGRLSAKAPISASEKKDPPKLNLQSGEFVIIRSADEILCTLNKDRKNRGLSFEREMFRYCGKPYRVLARVTRIIDEKTGKMIRLASDCIMLDGLVCHGLDNGRRLFCPRSPIFYWREAWLRRTNEPGSEKS